MKWAQMKWDRTTQLSDIYFVRYLTQNIIEQQRKGLCSCQARGNEVAWPYKIPLMLAKIQQHHLRMNSNVAGRMYFQSFRILFPPGTCTINTNIWSKYLSSLCGNPTLAPMGPTWPPGPHTSRKQIHQAPLPPNFEVWKISMWPWGPTEEME